MQAQFVQLAGSMEAVRMAADKSARPGIYNNQLKEIKTMQTAFNDAAMASGDFHVQTVKNISASQALTEAISKQKVGWKQARDEINAYKSGGSSALREMIKEQTALRQAMSTQWTSNAFGKNSSDLLIPKNLGTDLENAKIKYGAINQMLRSAATQTVNWGKNTQWAGRQIMVGITVPLAIAAAGAGAMALKVEQEMTRVIKVYDTTAQTAAGQEKELAQVRTTSLGMATQAANKYGMAVKDTLDIEAQLAQTGLSGSNLYNATTQAARIATLGEMDHQKAIDMTISLQNAYKLSNEDLSKSFDFMNAVENATSLSIQDIADAIPRAGSALATLGVNVQQTTVMLTAMKEAGVDANEAANALKSGAATILKPPPEAQKFWFKELGVNLPQILAKAKGNIYDFMVELGKATHGLDPTKVQEGITRLFGKYQFNRETALLKNLGDAASGVTNQTSKAMEIAGQSSAQWAKTSETELTRWQNSVQGKFKRTIESLKASMIPFGTAVLNAVTPIMGFFKSIIDGFNGLSPLSKNLIMWGAGLVAIVGPALMLIGIFGNLFGNMMKLGTWLASLKIRFKALTVEEAAMEINSKNIASVWNTEAQSAAYLAKQIRELTATITPATQAMVDNAVAAGAMMSSAGVIGNVGPAGPLGTNRTVTRRANGNLGYAAGSVDAAGNKLGNVRVSDADRKAFADMEARTAAMAKNTAATATNVARTGGIMPKLAVGALIFGSMATNSNTANNSMVNILEIATMLAMVMGPGMWKGISTGFMAMGASLGSMVGKAALGAASIAGAFRSNGLKAGLSTMGSMASRLTGLAGGAMKIWGPLGILAGGVIIGKLIAKNMNDQYAAQQKINASAKTWSDIQGFTYAPGTQVGADGKRTVTNEAATLQPSVDQLTEKMPELVKQLQEAAGASDHFASVFNLAMQESLKTLTNGGSIDDALKTFKIALKAANLSSVQIDDLVVKWKAVHLDNVDGVKAELAKQIANILGDLPDNTDSINGSWWRNYMGGHLDDDARAIGAKAGTAFSSAFMNESDPKKQMSLLTGFQGDIDKKFGGQFKNILSSVSPQMRKEFKKLGIDSMSELVTTMNKQADKGDLHIYEGLDDKAKSSLESYSEFFQVILQSMVDAGAISQTQMDKIVNGDNGVLMGNIKHMSGGLATLGNNLDLNKSTMMSTKEASDAYADSLINAAKDGNILTEAQKLTNLNLYRHKAGLDDATSSAQGFDRATESATAAVKGLGEALLEVTPDQLVSSQKNVMSGAWGDILTEANRQFDVQRKAGIDAIGKHYDDLEEGYANQEEAQKKSFDTETKNQTKYYDDQTKALKKSQDAEQKSYDARIDRLNAQKDAQAKAVDAQKDMLQKQIDAEQKADEERQKIFDAEQKRIQRLAEMANSKIDFNVALNSGNLDEAARLSNNNSATMSGWAMEDAQAALGDQSKGRQDTLKAQIDALDAKQKAAEDATKAEIDRIQKEKDARKDSYDAQLQQIEDAKNKALDATKARQDAEAAALDATRKNNSKAKDSAVQAAQDEYDADKRSLDMRLRALQNFVPQNEAELRAHIGDVQKMYANYGVNLQMQGKSWGGFVGDALKSNVDSAAVALQSEIKWQQVAANIASQMGSGLGMTMDQIKSFLMTGTFPKGVQTITPPYTGTPVKSAKGTTSGGGPGRQTASVFHAGGSPSFTQADRVGVPRDASPYHSEVVALLKRGEFVVNERATSKHADLLQAINSGNLDHISASRHTGGLAGFMAGLTAMQATATGEMAWFAAQEIKRRIAAQQAAAMEGAGGDGGYNGGITWPSLERIRQQLFPGSVLTDAFRPGANDWHGRGDAIDIGWPGNTQAGLMPIAARLAALYPDATELIHNPNGSIKNGKQVPGSFWGAGTWGAHANHVHWAMTPEVLARHHAAAMGPATANGTNQQIVQGLAAQRYGWTGAEWNSLYQLVMHESGFRNTAQNPSSTAYGMFQFLNSTWAGVGATKTSDPSQQALAGLAYVKQKYGDPIGAWNFWQGHHWYDQGGFLRPGATMTMNGTGKPEPVFTSEQWNILQRSLANGALMYQNLKKQNDLAVAAVSGSNGSVASGDNSSYNVTIDLRGAMVREDIDIEAAVYKALDKKEAKNGRRRVIG